jgi:hypothetical protein
MEQYTFQMTLGSDTTFGRGDGMAGVVDQEVEHDQYGFPFLHGRTLKGLLSEACDTLVAALPDPAHWAAALQRLFGSAGSGPDAAGVWTFGDAVLPADLRAAVAAQQRPLREGDVPALTPAMVLDSLTTVRLQTAIDARSGTPEENSLRAARVVRRDLVFSSTLTVMSAEADDIALLVAGALALRNVGSGRTRGRGSVRCELLDQQGASLMEAGLRSFEKAIK